MLLLHPSSIPMHAFEVHNSSDCIGTTASAVVLEICLFYRCPWLAWKSYAEWRGFPVVSFSVGILIKLQPAGWVLTTRLVFPESSGNSQNVQAGCLKQVIKTEVVSSSKAPAAQHRCSAHPAKGNCISAVMFTLMYSFDCWMVGWSDTAKYFSNARIF